MLKQFSRIEDVWTVRLKIIESCNWSCDFCHNEWDIFADQLAWDGELHNALLKLKNALWIREVHLTGWEPSLNSEINTLIDWIHSLGMIAKLTTNGQFSDEVRTWLVKHWIDSVNFSLQSVDPEVLIAMMKKWKTVAWARWQIDQSKKNIVELLGAWVKVRVNCVISDEEDYNKVQWVLDWCLLNGVETRILGDLLNKIEAGNAISNLVKRYGAKILKEVKTPWTSDARTHYTDQNGKEFIVKHIDPVYLPDLCEWCTHFWSNTCNEWFYNIRMQKDRKTWKFIVVLCIQNINQESVMDLDTFLSHYHNKKYEVPTIPRWSWSIQSKRIIPIRWL